MITRAMTTVIEGDQASITISYGGKAVLETTTLGNMNKERRTSVTLDREKAQDMIAVLTEYLDVVL